MTGHMIHLAIDGRPAQAKHGSTILDAAASLGIYIPTLCRLAGFKPFTSCFVCVVALEGRSTLVPACTMQVADGMSVLTSSPEVLDARRTALELLLSEHRGDCVAPCELACPARLDIASMCARLKSGNPRDAAETMLARIPFNSTLGRICPAFCERVCRRTLLDQPVSIAALQSFAGDAILADDSSLPAVSASTGKSVAIVGAGPAGLAAAFYLLRQGHACTLFDSNPAPGGMLRYAVGRFRLPLAVLDAEVRLVERLGATFRMNTTLGIDLSLDELRSRFDAVLLALGAQLPGSLECVGAELAHSALGFLREVAEGEPVEVRPVTLVVGSGQTAVEAARTALRLGCTNVTILSETDSAHAINLRGLEDARAEGVSIRTGVIPVRLEQTDSGTLRLTVREAGIDIILEADEVLAGADRVVDIPSLAQVIPTTAKGIEADRANLATSVPGVFAAGECVIGADYTVRAVAQGRQAALSIDQYLNGQTPVAEHQPINSRMGKLSPDEVALLRSTAHPATRTPGVSLTPEQSRDESARCLQCSCAARSDCDLRHLADECHARPNRYSGTPRPFQREATHPAIVYESGKCILCGRCVAIAKDAAEPLGLAFLQRGYSATVGVPFEMPLSEALKLSAQRVVASCPTGALAFKTGHNSP